MSIFFFGIFFLCAVERAVAVSYDDYTAYAKKCDYLHPISNYRQKRVRSSGFCKKECDGDQMCKAFEFDNNSGICVLRDTVRCNPVGVVRESGSYYGAKKSNGACFMRQKLAADKCSWANPPNEAEADSSFQACQKACLKKDGCTGIQYAGTNCDLVLGSCNFAQAYTQAGQWTIMSKGCFEIDCFNEFEKKDDWSDAKTAYCCANHGYKSDWCDFYSQNSLKAVNHALKEALKAALN